MRSSRLARVMLGWILLSLFVLTGHHVPTVRAASTSITDQASCEAAGGYWEQTRVRCRFFIDVEIGENDVWTVSVEVEFNSQVTIAGTLNLNQNYTDLRATVFNVGTINFIGRATARIRSALANRGTLNVSSSGYLELFPGETAQLINDGAVVLRGTIDNTSGGIVRNNGVIEVCGGRINGPVVGNAPSGCSSPTATNTRVPTATNTPPPIDTPTNTSIPMPTNTATHTSVPPTRTATQMPTRTVTPTRTSTPLPGCLRSGNKPRKCGTPTPKRTATPVR